MPPLISCVQTQKYGLCLAARLPEVRGLLRSAGVAAGVGGSARHGAAPSGPYVPCLAEGSAAQSTDHMRLSMLSYRLRWAHASASSSGCAPAG